MSRISPPQAERGGVRSGLARHGRGKVARLLAFVRCYRDCCAALPARERRTFHETGRSGAAGMPGCDRLCGADAAEMARTQVVALLKRFVADRQNQFRAPQAVPRAIPASSACSASSTFARVACPSRIAGASRSA
jgi:hypothetical protein